VQESGLAAVRLVLAYAFGFFVPGYAASLLLRSRSPLGSALPLSWLSLTLGAWLFQVSGVRFSFANLVAWQFVVALAAGSAWWRGPRRSARAAGAASPDRHGPARTSPAGRSSLLSPLRLCSSAC
jgi:hypothetical protein